MIGVMTYKEISNELNITKTAIHQNVKKAVNKTYINIEKNYTENCIDAIETLLLILNIDTHKDFKQLYRLFYKETRERIENSDEWKKYEQMYELC